MNYPRIYIGAYLLALTFIIHHAQANNNAGIPGSWAENPADHGGLDGSVQTIVSDGNGGLYAGGYFKSIDGAVVNHIARLDTATDTWESLGQGVNGPINALVVDDAGNVYAGGQFSLAGEKTALNVARWIPSTTSWESLSTEINGEVEALAIDDSGTLYASVSIPYSWGSHASNDIRHYVARWTPSTQSWSRVGLGMDDTIKSLAVDSTGRLYASGDFRSADFTEANGVARWNSREQTWEPLGGGLYDGVEALVIDAEDNLYAGGYFDYAGGQRVNNVARWNVDNEQWEPLGAGIDRIDYPPLPYFDVVHALSIDSQGRLLAGGEFENAAGVKSQNIAQWDPETAKWQGLDVGVQGPVYAIAFHDDGKGYVGGRFGTVGLDTISSNIGRWNQASVRWEALGSGIDESIYSVVEDRAGNTFIGGIFETINGNKANNIAYKDAAEEFWMPIRQPGSDDAIPSGMDAGVHSLLLDDEGNLYAGGRFSLRAGGTPLEGVHGVAKLSASTQQWEALGQGLPSGSRVEALAIGKSGNIYVGGDVLPTGVLTSENIARWNVLLQQWESLGDGLESPVEALVVDSNDNVIALTRVAVGRVSIHWWNAQEQLWQRLGPKLYAPIYSDLAIDDNDNLYTVLEDEDDIYESYVARWNPLSESWEPVGDKANESIYTIIVDSKNQLIAGGMFTKIGDTTANYLAAWNAEQGHWQALDRELDGWVRKLHVRSAGGFYASGGNFRLAGDVASPKLALWSPDATSTIVPILELPNARWRQISLPCNISTEITVSQLFGDDELGNYGSNWIMWGYDAEGREYTPVNQQTEISQGQAYWIFQRSGSSRQIDVPASCAATPRVGACPNPDGCFEVPLYGNSQASTYQMIGYPFSTAGKVDETYVITDTPDCAQGCVTGSHEANKYLYPLLFTFDGESYKTVGPGGNFSPWAGYWALVRPAAANANARLGFAQ